MVMHIIFVVLLLGAFAIGITIGVMLTVARYQAMAARQDADEEELAEVAELFAAWAALRAGTCRPPGNADPWM